VTFLAALLAVLVAIPTGIFALECLVGLLPAKPSGEGRSRDADVTIVVPAHDEAVTISATLKRLNESAEGIANVVVVADNCSDETAELARRAGVTVLERNDALKRGKGFALAFAQDHLRADPPEVVLVLDADCVIDRGSLRSLLNQVLSSGRPVQAVYLLRPAAKTSPVIEVSNFAFMLRNLIRQRGLQRLAGSVHLTGTGMGFPWKIFERAELATANIVEDMKLGLELTEAGQPPQLAYHATVWSEPSSVDGTLRQRERWEGGFLDLAKSLAPSTLLKGLQRADCRLILRALDIFVPPLVLLMVANLLVATGLVLFAAVGGAAWWPLGLQVAVLFLAGSGVAAAWAFYGRQFLAARTLIAIPFYMLWKLPMYLRIRRGSADEWLRAGR
jgi:cellulose synthase/poly-beta-1,6-N-acetylglucosamine synthase-like glycosyltransferase